MTLDMGRLEGVRKMGDGSVVARCPACARSGGDKKCEHLVVYPDGRFGCVANPGPGGAEHRSLIFSVAGDGSSRTPRTGCAVSVRKMARPAAVTGGKLIDLGRLGRLFDTYACEKMESPPHVDVVDKTYKECEDPVRAVREATASPKAGDMSALLTRLGNSAFDDDPLFGDDDGILP